MGEKPQIELTLSRSDFGFSSGLKAHGSATAAMQLQQRITAQPLLMDRQTPCSCILAKVALS